mmetsp:Transcript_26086/g.47717  ORF Transcript_26086/g.47717 Transcript_26086/m.47717 type:complete len:80 (+) Transcript_26086:1243-1482(+)
MAALMPTLFRMAAISSTAAISIPSYPNPNPNRCSSRISNHNYYYFITPTRNHYPPGIFIHATPIPTLFPMCITLPISDM